MIKKQILCCSAIFSLLVLAKWSNGTSENQMEQLVVEPASTSITLAEAGKQEKMAYYASLHFANEHLPFGDMKVESKMMRHLQNYSFKQIGSYQLHKQAESALPLVEQILISYGIPPDFKYIPMIESGFTSGLTSHKGASGYWQFMPATARAFGLRVDESVDERQDLVKSTHAAAKYINVLYDEFGSWVLVAAAYNVGGGNLRKAIERQNERNYFKLNLNRETADYVYRLISVKEIIEKPAMHGYAEQKTRVANADFLTGNTVSLDFIGTF